MLSRVIAKNVGDVFFETQCIIQWCWAFFRINSQSKHGLAFSSPAFSTPYIFGPAFFGPAFSYPGNFVPYFPVMSVGLWSVWSRNLRSCIFSRPDKIATASTSAFIWRMSQLLHSVINGPPRCTSNNSDINCFRGCSLLGLCVHTTGLFWSTSRLRRNSYGLLTASQSIMFTGLKPVDVMIRTFASIFPCIPVVPWYAFTMYTM